MPTLEAPIETRSAPKKVNAKDFFSFGPPNETLRFILTSKDTGGQYALLSAEAEANVGPPYHMHTREDEMFMIHEGQVEFTVGGEKIVAGPGDRVWAPRNVPHSFRTLTKARFDNVVTGSNFEQFLPKFYGALKEGNFVLANEIAEEHGMVLMPTN